MTKRVTIYLRVSTGEQTTTNQQREIQRPASRPLLAAKGRRPGPV
jgi:hypothetical protein